MKSLKVPIRYLPKGLSKKDKKKQIKMLMMSKKLYKQHKYSTRKKLSSYKNKKSNHISNARRIYTIQNITPNKELALKTGCKLSALKQIVKKGEGAYYSSGSRPNQTIGCPRRRWQVPQYLTIVSLRISIPYCPHR